MGNDLSCNMGIVRLDVDALRRAAGLPPGTEVVDVRLAFEVAHQIELKIAHGDLPKVREGEAIPTVTCLLGSDGFIRWVSW